MWMKNKLRWLHYQKIYEYKWNHQWKKSISIFGWYLSTKLISLLTLFVFNNKIFLSVNIEGIPVRIKGV